MVVVGDELMRRTAAPSGDLIAERAPQRKRAHHDHQAAQPKDQRRSQPG
jgi:hypothetical protein